MKEHIKGGSDTGVKSDLAFCFGSFVKKTNSDTPFNADFEKPTEQD